MQFVYLSGFRIFSSGKAPLYRTATGPTSKFRLPYALYLKPFSLNLLIEAINAINLFNLINYTNPINLIDLINQVDPGGR